MKVKVIKNVECLKGLVFSVEDPQLKEDFSGVCEHLSEDLLEMSFSDCIFKKGAIVEMQPNEIKRYGKAYFERHFEILEGGPKEEETQETPLVLAMMKLMDEGKVSAKTGMPSCPDLSAILKRDVSKKERDEAFEAAFEEVGE